MKIRVVDGLLLAALAFCASVLRADDKILVGSGKSKIIDTAVTIERVSVAASEIAEAIPVSARTIMVNGKTPGETSLIVWLADGTRTEYDVSVKLAATRIEAATQQIKNEFEGKVTLSVDNTAAYLTGTVQDMFSSQRAVAIAETVGKVVNLLHVEVPPREAQILLKVRFANVDRSRSTDLGINFVGGTNGFPYSVTTGAFSPGRITGINPPVLSLSDSLNLLFFDPHLNVGATLKDLESKAALQILAEPNLLAMNGREASFVSGGEFPFPTLQGGGSGVGQITVQFRQFGVQIRFLATITPRGTIRLKVSPEVSSLDYANALTVSGFTVPALNTRRVNTEVELMDKQTFAIAGLLDQRTTESLSRIPGLADIPLFGKLFTSRSTSKSNSELLVIVTPELVAPIDGGKEIPDLERPLKFLKGPGILSEAPRTPGTDKTGPAAVKNPRQTVPVQEMEKIERDMGAQIPLQPVVTSLAPPQPPSNGVSAGGGPVIDPGPQASTTPRTNK